MFGEKSVPNELMIKDHDLRMAMNSVFSSDLPVKLMKHTKGTSLIQEQGTLFRGREGTRLPSNYLRSLRLGLWGCPLHMRL